MSTSPEKFISKYEGRGEDPNSFYKEGVANHIKNGRMATGLIAFLGAGIILSVFVLYKKNKKIA